MSKASKITASELVLSAIFFLQHKNGVTAKDITKFICNKRKCKHNLIKGEVKKALHRATKKGIFVKKGGLYRINSGFGSNKMSRKFNRTQRANDFKNLGPKNTAEQWDYELRQSPHEHTVFNLAVMNDLKRRNFQGKETFQNKFLLLENKDMYQEGQSGGRIHFCRDDEDDEDEDDDFLEDDDDDDDRDFFEDDQFPKPEDALREVCRRPPRKKPCKTKKNIKSRSKSKNKCKSKKRRCPKRPKKSCRRKRIVKCNVKKRMRYDDDSSMDEDNNYGDDDYNENRRKIKTEKKNDYGENIGGGENIRRRIEGIEREITKNQSREEYQSVENEIKQNRGIESGDENEEENGDYNGDEENEQKVGDNKNQNQADQKCQSDLKEEYQKQLNNKKEGNQTQHDGSGVKEKATNNINVSKSSDSDANAKESTKNAKNGNKGSSAESSPVQENLSNGFSNKKTKRQRSSSLFRSLKKKTSSEEVSESKYKSVKRKKKSK